MRPKSFDTAYLDSSVLIRYVQRQDGWQTAEYLLQANEMGQLRLMTSTLLLVECLGQAPNANYDPAKEARVMEMIDNPRLMPVEFDRRTAKYARELHLTKTVKSGVCDAIHLASAIKAGADVFMTFDTDDFPIGSRIERTWVDTPYIPGEDPLFDP